jgi:dTDP-4-dehydrorhamnose 3,5-epimerase
MVEEKIDIEGLKIFNRETFCDHRGYFMELYNELRLNKAIHEDVSFVQDNISNSHKNVVRGLHFQAPPFAQGKLVKVLKGKIMDIVVDIRKESVTYGKHLKIELSEQNHTQLWIPEGFAHGFIALEDNTLLSYKCTNYYSKEHEMALLWNDPDLNIDWDIENPIVSEKDLEAPTFKTFKSPF